MKVFRIITITLFILCVNFGLNAQCSITLDAGTSGCYISGGQSRSTITVEVGWTNAPTGQNIIITGPPGSVPATRIITPGTITVQYNDGISTFVNSTQFIVSPQLVAFEIPANGTTGLNVSAAFSSTASCNATSNPFNAPTACQPLACASGNLGGHSFF
ncbi:MAG: hypothetical protein IPK35_17330 [Saprospiraceae bacterium]|jgi:hypothetical protein|nr:hypothetical protein [Saprospiraceae bacterium]